ncbi:MAG TPA: zf-HC2 domain-containing protein [Planctomycetota bacterium]|nr:zf-HC2 domain-containing protein [Planctomycetota bacterium]
MKCDEIRESIAEYHDRELDAERAERVRAHLAGCPACAGELRDLEGLETALRAVPVRADDVRWDGYVARLRDRITASRASAWKAFIPLAAAALLVWGFTRVFTVENGGSLVDRYAVADDAGRERIEREAARLGQDGVTALVTVLIADPVPARQRIAARLLGSRMNEDPVRRLLVERSREVARQDAAEVVLVDIGFEPGDDELVAPALEMARSERLFPDALRILKRLDRGTLNRSGHGEIVRRLRELLASDLPREREVGFRIARELEILLEDIVEFLDVPALAPQAREFLRRRTGRDFGTDKAAWRAWFARKS